jgi:hypothetical protein
MRKSSAVFWGAGAGSEPRNFPVEEQAIPVVDPVFDAHFKPKRRNMKMSDFIPWADNSDLGAAR